MAAMREFAQGTIIDLRKVVKTYASTAGTYKVTIKPGRQDARFRWNMTASVTMTPR